MLKEVQEHTYIHTYILYILIKVQSFIYIEVYTAHLPIACCQMLGDDGT